MFPCPPSINKNKDLENWNLNIWRLWCREQVIKFEYFGSSNVVKKLDVNRKNIAFWFQMNCNGLATCNVSVLTKLLLFKPKFVDAFFKIFTHGVATGLRGHWSMEVSKMQSDIYKFLFELEKWNAPNLHSAAKKTLINFPPISGLRYWKITYMLYKVA